MRMKLCMTVLLAWLVFCGSTVAAVVPRIEVNPDGKGLNYQFSKEAIITGTMSIEERFWEIYILITLLTIRLTLLSFLICSLKYWKIRREKYRYSGNFLPESGFIRPSLSVGKRLNGILNSSTEAIIRLIFWICV